MIWHLYQSHLIILLSFTLRPHSNLLLTPFPVTTHIRHKPHLSIPIINTIILTKIDFLQQIGTSVPASTTTQPIPKATKICFPPKHGHEPQQAHMFIFTSRLAQLSHYTFVSSLYQQKSATLPYHARSAMITLTIYHPKATFLPLFATPPNASAMARLICLYKLIKPVTRPLICLLPW